MKKTFLLLSVLFAFLLIFSFGCEPEEAVEEPVDDPDEEVDEVEELAIGWATSGPEDHQYTIAARKFEELVEEKSGGNMEVVVYPDGQLGGEREMIEAVAGASVEMGSFTTDGALPAWVPETQVFTLPFLFADRDHVYENLDGELGEALAEYKAEEGLKHLGYIELGFRHMTNNVRAIETVDDMEGLTIRVQEAPLWFLMLDALDATAEPIAFDELYSALQQGVVDGQENPLNTIRSMRFYEVQDYLSLTEHTYAPGSILMNLDFWNGLSEQQQQIIQEAADEAVVYQREWVQQRDEENIEYLEEQGMVISEPDRSGFMEATAHIPDLDEVEDEVPSYLVDMVLEGR